MVLHVNCFRPQSQNIAAYKNFTQIESGKNVDSEFGKVITYINHEEKEKEKVKSQFEIIHFNLDEVLYQDVNVIHYSK